MTAQDNELLTRVCGDAPMGRMMRQHWWIPAAVSEKLLADGKPQRLKLFGKRYVAFRATDGQVGFFDEACPHRGASLALARPCLPSASICAAACSCWISRASCAWLCARCL